MVNVDASLDVYKNAVKVAAKNLISVAEEAIMNKQTVKKDVVLQATPRHDPVTIDLLSFKRALVHVFNTALVESQMASSLRDKIYIGQHDLVSNGAIFEARYQDIIRKRFDGVHLWGPSGSKAYTLSLFNVLNTCGILFTSKPVAQLYSNYCYDKLNGKRNRGRISRPVNQVRVIQRVQPNLVNENDGSVQNNREESHNLISVPTYNRFAPLNY